MISLRALLDEFSPLRITPRLTARSYQLSSLQRWQWHVSPWNRSSLCSKRDHGHLMNSGMVISNGSTWLIPVCKWVISTNAAVSAGTNLGSLISAGLSYNQRTYLVQPYPAQQAGDPTFSGISVFLSMRITLAPLQFACNRLSLVCRRRRSM